MKRKRVTLIVSLLMVIIVVLVVRAVFSDGTSPDSTLKKKPVQVRVVPASVERISDIVELTGSVEPQRTARLASPAEGPVMNVNVREGDRVTQGDMLLSIGRTEGIEARITSFREAVKKEEENLNRTQQLVESQAVAGEVLDRARAAYENARAQLVQAMESVRDYSVFAPWDGVVSSVNVRDGDYVIPRSPLVEVYDPSNLVIQAAVPERYSAGIRNGMVLRAQLDAIPDSVFQARIVRIYPFLDDRMRTRTIEVGIATDVPILPGMFARLQLPITSVDSATVVPNQSVLILPSGAASVFVIDADTAVQRIVELGIEQENRVEVVSGVRPGELVVVSGNEKLKPGTGVRLIRSDTGSIGAVGN